MLFSESLKKYGDFQRVYKRGRSYANKYLIMYVLKQDVQENRIGISVSKKVRKQCGKTQNYAINPGKLSIE